MHFINFFPGSATATQSQSASSSVDAFFTSFSSSKAPASVGGKASLQPKRTPVSNDEIEAILVTTVILIYNSIVFMHRMIMYN